jgi:hypothetical protein
VNSHSSRQWLFQNAGSTILTLLVKGDHPGEDADIRDLGNEWSLAGIAILSIAHWQTN